MPKLGSDVAKQAKQAGESGGFTPVPDGVYLARLVDVKAKQSSNQNPMWVWEFEIVSDADGNDEVKYEAPLEGGGTETRTMKVSGKKLWNNTTLIDSTMWKVAESFAGFGVDTDTDTDELIGETVKLAVSVRTIGAGARAGQLGNNVDSVLAKNPTGPGAGGEAASADSSSSKTDDAW